jgi:uncharacterized membrane protein SpoIIM required for sporulation
MSRFVNERKNNWQRLEDLLALIETSALQRLSKAEVREFGELYRRAASDLAIARAESRDPRLVNYLNSLVIRAHGKIYRAEGQGVNLVWNFLAKDFPQTFRQNINYFKLAAITFCSFAVLGFILTWQDLDFSQFVYADVRSEAQNNVQWWTGINTANQVMSTQILTNNILVAFRVFARGVFFGIGAFYGLAFEGTRLGSVFAVCYKVNPEFGNALATFVVGHGVIELSCIVICGAAGMMLGYTLINPGDLTRLQAFKKKGIEATKIVLGCACILVVAGIIEGFLSPSDLPAIVKIGTGLLTGIAMFSYLFLVGRKTGNESSTESPV